MLVAAVGVLLLAAIVASFALGRFVEAPTRDAIEAAQKPVRVLAGVESRVVDSRPSFAGTIKAGKTMDVTVTSDVDPAVVTRQNLGPGDVLAPGALLGVVSGEPYFALPAPLPLYRDLPAGATGDDVTALQGSLLAAGSSVRVTGRIDSATLVAVRALFAAQGFALPSGSAIPFRQFLPVATPGAIVVSAAPVGVTLDAKTPLAVLRASTNYATFRADAIETQKVTVGSKLTVQAGTQTYPATVQSIGGFTNGTGSELPGRDIDLAVIDPAFAKLADGTSVTIIGSGSTARSNGRAAHGRAAGQPGATMSSAGRQPRVEIGSSASASRVVRNGGGWAAISAGTLHVGDKVAVS
ncbi:MAG: hypothetical protein WDM88_00260 [Galbitalea sp.]